MRKPVFMIIDQEDMGSFTQQIKLARVMESEIADIAVGFRGLHRSAG